MVVGGGAEQVELIVGVFFDLEGEGHETGAVDQNRRSRLATAAQALFAQLVAVVFGGCLGHEKLLK